MEASNVIVQPAEMRKSFISLQDGYDWAVGLINAGVSTQISRLRSYFFKSFRKGDRYFMLLGVVESTAKACKRIEPAGEWRIEIESPGTEYQKAGILSPVNLETTLWRFSAWYSRFLPYAVGMLRAEWGFDHPGIDFESINAYYGTCYGFHYLGEGDGYEKGPPEYHRIIAEDLDLYEDCYNASNAVKSPNLPFDEVHRACLVYVACHQAWRIAEMVDKDHGWRRHVASAFEHMGRPQPDYRRKR